MGSNVYLLKTPEDRTIIWRSEKQAWFGAACVSAQEVLLWTGHACLRYTSHQYKFIIPHIQTCKHEGSLDLLQHACWTLTLQTPQALSLYNITWYKLNDISVKSYKASGVLVHHVHWRSLRQGLLHIGRWRDVWKPLAQVNNGRICCQRSEGHPETRGKVHKVCLTTQQPARASVDVSSYSPHILVQSLDSFGVSVPCHFTLQSKTTLNPSGDEPQSVYKFNFTSKANFFTTARSPKEGKAALLEVKQLLTWKLLFAH